MGVIDVCFCVVILFRDWVRLIVFLFFGLGGWLWGIVGCCVGCGWCVWLFLLSCWVFGRVLFCGRDFWWVCWFVLLLFWCISCWEIVWDRWCCFWLIWILRCSCWVFWCWVFGGWCCVFVLLVVWGYWVVWGLVWGFWGCYVFLLLVWSWEYVVRCWGIFWWFWFCGLCVNRWCLVWVWFLWSVCFLGRLWWSFWGKGFCRCFGWGLWVFWYIVF